LSSYNKCNSSIIKENKEVSNELYTIEFRRKVFYRERVEIKDVAEQDRKGIGTFGEYDIARDK